MEELAFGDLPWVIFRLKDQSFALPATEVQEMLAMPKVTPVPKASAFMRGVINLRGTVMPLIDLRQRLNLASALEDLNSLLETITAREEDLRRWAHELETALRQDQEFSLPLDPHQCAFGRWYDAFQTDNLELSGVILKLERPHKRLHALGRQALELKAQGEEERALALLEEEVQARLLPYLQELFEDLRRAIRRTHREIALVVEVRGELLALAVDQVEAVEALPAETIEEVSHTFGGQDDHLVTKLARRRDTKETVLILDLSVLLNQELSLDRSRYLPPPGESGPEG
jgi:purine-binding chemotaxis protein CheW